MAQVLRADLDWKEEAWQHSDVFVGKRIAACQVYQDEEKAADAIKVAMTLVDKHLDSKTIILVAYSNMDLNDHYILHTFLSNPKTGCVVENFPEDRAIVSACIVTRVEQGRTWACAGHTMTGGCWVAGIQFAFESVAIGDHDTHHVILHCWEQCKPIPYCGDQHSPSYRLFSVREDLHLVDGQKKGTFLSANFLAHLGAGDNFSPIDASGMDIVGTPRGQTLKYYKNIFALVQKSLGLGCWSGDDRPLWQFRKKHSGQALLRLTAPQKQNNMIGFLGLQEQPGKWKDIFNELCEAAPGDSVVMHGTYEDIQEILTLPVSQLTSRELNATLINAASKDGPTLVFPVVKAEEFLQKVFRKLQTSTSHQGREELSVRFTDGTSLRALGLDRLEQQQISKFKSSAQHGCKGGSLGFHLATSSEMRNVVTLHGSIDDLLSDLTTKFSSAEVENYRGLIRNGSISNVLSLRTGGAGYSFNEIGTNEAMSLRISNPSAHAVIACATIFPDGRVNYDMKNHAVYPITYDGGGNLQRAPACAVILEILQTMKKYQSLGIHNLPSKIQFQMIR